MDKLQCPDMVTRIGAVAIKNDHDGSFWFEHPHYYYTVDDADIDGREACKESLEHAGPDALWLDCSPVTREQQGTSDRRILQFVYPWIYVNMTILLDVPDAGSSNMHAIVTIPAT